MAYIRPISRRRKGKTWGRHPSRASQMSRADLLCAAVVKKRDGYRCTLCGSTKNIHWSHVLSRGSSYHKVRHDLENSTSLCQRCHFRWTNDPNGWEVLWRGLMGQERADALWARAKIQGQKPDYEAVIFYLQSVAPDCPRPWFHQTR